MGLAQVNPELASPETLNEILHEIMQAGGIEIDVNNTESELRLAESRYDKLLSLIGDNPEKTDDPMWNEGVAKQILQAPEFQPFVIEDHATISKFYIEKIYQVLATPEPDYLLATCLQGMIDLQMGAQVKQAQQQMALQMAAQAPAQMAAQEEQMQMQQQQGQQAEQQAMQQAQMAEQQASADQQSVAEEREFQAQQKELEYLDKEEDRKLKREEIKAKSNGK
jgi:hypothetical protein